MTWPADFRHQQELAGFVARLCRPFLGEIVDGVESQWPRYTVRLVFEPEVALPDAGANRSKPRTYLIQYSLNWQTGEGYVYLPGPSESGYRENAGVIIRDGHDGRWHRAEATWCFSP